MRGVPFALSGVEEPTPAKAGGQPNGTRWAPSPNPRRPYPTTPLHPPPPSPSTELECPRACSARTWASVLLSPSPLKALRERGTKGVRVPLWGGAAHAESSLSVNRRAASLLCPHTSPNRESIPREALGPCSGDRPVALPHPLPNPAHSSLAPPLVKTHQKCTAFLMCQ